MCAVGNIDGGSEGLRGGWPTGETLEYPAFLRVDGELEHGDDGPFFGDGWNGLLVVQDLEDETLPLEEQETMKILQASELEDRLEALLDRLV